jgi:hypothetical protein
VLQLVYDAETEDTSEVHYKFLRSSEMCYWRRMDKISWIDRVRNLDVLQRVEEERYILHTMQR